MTLQRCLPGREQTVLIGPKNPLPIGVYQHHPASKCDSFGFQGWHWTHGRFPGKSAQTCPKTSIHTGPGRQDLTGRVGASGVRVGLGAAVTGLACSSTRDFWVTHLV